MKGEKSYQGNRDRDRGLAHTALQLAAHTEGTALFQIENGFSAGEKYSESVKPFGHSPTL